MTEVVVRLPDEARSFVEQQVAARRLASASEFLVTLVEEARRRAVVADVDQKLLEGLASGPGEEATSDWWDKTREEWRQSRPGASTP